MCLQDNRCFYSFPWERQLSERDSHVSTKVLGDNLGSSAASLFFVLSVTCWQLLSFPRDLCSQNLPPAHVVGKEGIFQGD